MKREGVPLSRSKVSKLVAGLNSAVESEAKRVASFLDGLLYPNYGPGPRIVTAAESQQIQEEHYRTVRGSAALDPLLDTTRDGTEFARASAATALGAIGERRALPLLVNALSDPSPTVRASATQGLGFFRDPSTVPALIRALDDLDTEVSCSAASALGYIGRGEAVPPLMALYERSDWRSKVAALGALGWICDPRSLPLVRAALSERVRRVRDAAKSALAQYDFRRRSKTKEGASDQE